jgi:hypothetical protein
VGLLLAAKHSGILIGPILLLLIGWEIAFAPRGERGQLALRLARAFAVTIVIAIGMLWAFYGFRYTARPAGPQLIPSLSSYSESLTPFQKGTIGWMARLHLLPESYLFGMVDVRVFARVFSTFGLGQWYPHGVWWYFPVVLAIKTTLGLMALLGLAVFAMVTGKLGNWQERDRMRPLVYLLLPGALYLAAAMLNGLRRLRRLWRWLRRRLSCPQASISRVGSGGGSGPGEEGRGPHRISGCDPRHAKAGPAAADGIYQAN